MSGARPGYARQAPDVQRSGENSPPTFGEDSTPSDKLISLFSKLGITSRDSNGQIRSTAVLLPELAYLRPPGRPHR